MTKKAKNFIDFVSNHSQKHDKARVQEEVVNKFCLTEDGKVYYCDSFAVRFNFTKSNSFSNAVLSLSHLEKFDHIPFFVVLVRAQSSNIIYLSNSTFLNKISHSSKQLSVKNIKGTFLGSNIMKKFCNLDNNPSNFDELFAIHCGIDWEDNLLRLVETTSRIKPTCQKFNPSTIQKTNIYNSIDISTKFISSNNFQILNLDLNDRVESCGDAILVASRIENTNIRGRLIETLITTNSDMRKSLLENLCELEQELPVYSIKNGLGDYVREFENGNTLTDIKTKIVYLNSNPKAFNIDKFLETMANENTIFFFYFVGIDENGKIKKALCSVYHDELIKNTISQFHWAGIARRGATQYNGKTINKILNSESFKNNIDKQIAKAFLEELLKL